MARSVKIYKMLWIAMIVIIFIASFRRSISLFLITQNERVLMDFLKLYPLEYLVLYISNLFLQIGSLAILIMYKKLRKDYMIPFLLVLLNIVENSILAVSTVSLLTYGYVIFNGIYISILSASSIAMYLTSGDRT